MLVLLGKQRQGPDRKHVLVRRVGDHAVRVEHAGNVLLRPPAVGPLPLGDQPHAAPDALHVGVVGRHQSDHGPGGVHHLRGLVLAVGLCGAGLVRLAPAAVSLLLRGEKTAGAAHGMAVGRLARSNQRGNGEKGGVGEADAPAAVPTAVGALVSFNERDCSLDGLAIF